MERSRVCPCVLHGFVGPTDPEDMHREPDPTLVRYATPVSADDTAVSLRGRRKQEDVSVAEGVDALDDPRGVYLVPAEACGREEEME